MSGSESRGGSGERDESGACGARQGQGQALDEAARLRQTAPASSPDMRRQIARLRRRVEQLEAEVQENRRLNRRLAELTDVVQELLVPISQRDEEKLRERLEKYSESL